MRWPAADRQQWFLQGVQHGVPHVDCDFWIVLLCVLDVVTARFFVWSPGKACLMALLCVVGAALAAGLTMGLVSIDPMEMEIIVKTEDKDSTTHGCRISKNNPTDT